MIPPATRVAPAECAGDLVQKADLTPPPGNPPVVAGTRTADLLGLARDPFLISTLYRHPDRLGSVGNAVGAIGVNAGWRDEGGTPWFIEQQRYGADRVQAGVVLNDAALVSMGLRVLQWGFARQAADGGFPGTGDPVHSTSLFVEAAARSACLLQRSGVPLFAKEGEKLTPKVLAAARWLAEREGDPAARAWTLDPYTHRFYLRAAALGEAAALTGDHALAQAAANLARDGLAKQLPDGTNPEKGGFDVSYQLVGLYYAMCYFSVCEDPALRAGLREMARKALARVQPKIAADGTISLKGSLRVGREPGRSGRTKTFDYKNSIQGLVFAGLLLDDPSFQVAAEQLAQGHAWK